MSMNDNACLEIHTRYTQSQLTLFGFVFIFATQTHASPPRWCVAVNALLTVVVDQYSAHWLLQIIPSVNVSRSTWIGQCCT